MKTLKTFVLTNLSVAIMLLLCSITPPAKAQKKLIDYNFEEWMQPTPLSNKFVDPNYYIWCGSVMKEQRDGKYYMLYSRWPRTDGFYSWAVTSEIAVAVSDKPGGPFKHLKVALPARGTSFWDGSATHNPSLLFFKGKYYLYYMGLSSTTPMTFPVNDMSSEAWYSYRNKQRIGVAVADSLSGNWTRFDKPVLDIDTSNDNNPDYDAVNNPAATLNDSGKVLLVYKQIAKGTDWHAGAVRCGAATADTPTGPFLKYPKLIFAPPAGSTKLPVEDPFIWFKEGYYYAVMRDAEGIYTGDNSALVLMTSPDGFDWQVAKHPKVLGSTFLFEDGSKNVSRVERPWFLIENGIPTYFYGATRGDAAMTYSYNVAIPLKEPIITALKDSITEKAKGTITVSGSNLADATYNSLSAAMDSINQKDQKDKNILILVKDTVADFNPARLSGDAGMWKSLTIRPKTPKAMLYTVLNTGFIKLSGAKNVLIDGRINGTGNERDLTIRNADINFSSALLLTDDASDNTIKHCRIESRSKSAAVAITSGITTGNDNNRIDSCTIGNNTDMSMIGIDLNNSSMSTINDGNIVSNCSILNVGSISASSATGISISARSNNTSVINNKIYWTKKLAPATTSTICGIIITGTGQVIQGNTIGYATENQTGTSEIDNANSDIRFIGIQAVGTTTQTSPVSIKNNKIANITLTTKSAGDANYGIMSGIYIKALTNSYAEVSGNILNKLTLNQAAAKSSSVYWTLTGILTFATGNVISGNTLSELSASGTTDAIVSMVRCIHVDKTVTLAAKISQNVIGDITSGKTTSTVGNQVYGMFSGSQGESTVERNQIYNLKALSATGSALNAGILLYNQSTTSTFSSVVKNNMIALGSNMATGSALYGILQQDNKSANAKVNIYHNTIRIGGTVTTGTTTGATACLYRQVSKAEAPVDAKNNIFVNERSGGSTGIHSIFRLTAATDYSSSFLTCNNNLYNAPSTTKAGMIGTTELATFATWKSTTGYDAASFFSDPAFVAADAVIPDLHIRKNTTTDADKKATSLAVTDDFDGETRSVLTPNDFGADAFVSENSTGVNANNKNANSLSVYSSGNQLRIVGEAGPGATASICDISGRMVTEVKLREGILNTIETSRLSKGVYLLIVRDASGKSNLKFRVE